MGEGDVQVARMCCVFCVCVCVCVCGGGGVWYGNSKSMYIAVALVPSNYKL